MENLSLSSERFEEITNALEEKGVKSPCPRCGERSFSITEGYTLIVLQNEDGKEFQRTFPMVSVVCTNCGCKFEHSSVVLGLDGAKEETEETEETVERESSNEHS